MKTLVTPMLTTSNNKAMKKPTNTKRVGPSPTTKPKPKKNITTNKQQPLKVVYISNPVWVKATDAAEFRAIVQEFTGQDAADWPSPSPSLSPSSSSSPKEYQVPRVVPENASNDDVDAPDICRVDDFDSVKLSCFGSDLGCFGPFDGDYDLVDQDDRTVVVDNELDMSLIYGFLQQ